MDLDAVGFEVGLAVLDAQLCHYVDGERGQRRSPPSTSRPPRTTPSSISTEDG